MERQATKTPVYECKAMRRPIKPLQVKNGTARQDGPGPAG